MGRGAQYATGCRIKEPGPRKLIPPVKLEKETTETLLRKINTKAFAMNGALLLIIAGIFMILKGIKDQGSIDLKAPFLTGKVESGFVGISLIVASVFIIIGTLH